MAGGIVGSVLGNQARPLRNLLFRLVDTAMPQTVENVSFYYCCLSFVLVQNMHFIVINIQTSTIQAVGEALSIGAPLLLPPLRERMELLHSLLSQGPDRWDSLSKGQVRLRKQL